MLAVVPARFEGSVGAGGGIAVMVMTPGGVAGGGRGAFAGTAAAVGGGRISLRSIHQRLSI